MTKSEIAALAANRRAFLKGAGLTGLGLASATVMGSKLGIINGSSQQKVEAASPTATDIEVLNFALNLEYLEAEFYTVATTGKTLEESGFDVSGTGNSGATTGGNIVNFKETSTGVAEKSGVLDRYVYQICNDEQQHVLLLRAALGDQAIAKPAINLDALGEGFKSFMDFLVVARAFEDTGSSAYAGAAPLLSSATIGTAAQILATESYHASLLRQGIVINNIATTPLDALDVVPPPSGYDFINAASNGLAVVRSTSRVLAIVYGSHTTGTTRGGFFPEGVNGAINTV